MATFEFSASCLLTRNKKKSMKWSILRSERQRIDLEDLGVDEKKSVDTFQIVLRFLSFR